MDRPEELCWYRNAPFNICRAQYYPSISTYRCDRAITNRFSTLIDLLDGLCGSNTCK